MLSYRDGVNSSFPMSQNRGLGHPKTMVMITESHGHGTSLASVKNTQNLYCDQGAVRYLLILPERIAITQLPCGGKSALLLQCVSICCAESLMRA
jgi:hypothetical protein